MDEGGDGGSFPDVEGADAFGSMEFVGGEGDEVDGMGGDVQGNFSGGLYGVGVEEGLVFMGDLGEFVDGLDGSDDVVGGHDGDESGIGSERGFEGFGVDEAVLVDGELGDFDALVLEVAAGLQDGGVFDGADDDVGVLEVLGFEGAAQGEVVGFGTAGGKDDFFGEGVDEFGDMSPGLFDGLARFASRGMEAGGIGELGAEEGLHGIGDAGVEGGGGGVVEV